MNVDLKYIPGWNAWPQIEGNNSNFDAKEINKTAKSTNSEGKIRKPRVIDLLSEYLEWLRNGATVTLW